MVEQSAAIILWPYRGCHQGRTAVEQETDRVVLRDLRRTASVLREEYSINKKLKMKNIEKDTDKDRRQYRYELPPEFPLTLPCSRIVHHLSDPA